MSFFGYALEVLASFGFYDFFLPWLLILAVVFGILQSKQMISEQVSVNGAIAFAISFLGTILLHSFFVRFFTLFGIALAGLLALIIFAALFDFKPKELIKDVKEWNKNAIPGLLILTTAAIFFLALGFNAGDALYLLNTPIIATVLLIVIFAVVVGFIVSSGKSDHH